MKKLLLIMLITIVVISCKKEEKSNVGPLPINGQEYVKVDRNMFPKDQQVTSIYEILDDGVHNPAFNYIIESSIVITSNSTDSTLNIKLPKRFYVENDSLKRGPDSTFRINLNKFVVEGRDTVFQMGKYKIFSPFRTGSITQFTTRMVLEYKSDDLEYYRKIQGSVYN